MSDFARVDSVRALKEFRVSLCKFAERARTGLDEADSAIHRTRVWLTQEQHVYWKGQIPKRGEAVTRAKLELTRKTVHKTPLGGKYSVVEERKALAVAKRRLEEAEQKFANVRRWIRQLEHEVFAYKGPVRGVERSIEHDVPAGVARLDNMIEALEAYAAVTAPDEAPRQQPDEEGAADAT